MVRLSLQSALRRGRTRPLRTLLTLLQLLLGALAMTVALSAYLGTPQVAVGGGERFDLVAGSREAEGSSSSYSLFSEGRLGELRALTPDVATLALYESAFSPRVALDGRLFQFRGAAVVSPEYFGLEGVAPTRGALFSRLEQGEAVMLISDASARILFGDEDPIGRELLMMPEPGAAPPGEAAPPPTPFRVVGTFADAEGGSEAFFQEPVYLPIWRSGAGEPLEAQASTLSVLAKPGRGAAAREQVLAAARQVFADDLREWGRAEGSDFYIEEPGERFGMPGNVVNPIVLLFGLFGIVALVAGAIGIFSIMVVDVVERGHEIGLRRALGATRARIGAELVSEAALLAALGGALGTALTAAVIPLLAAGVGDTLFFDVRLEWQPLAALLVVALVVVVSALLSLFPALQAARLKPVQALSEV